MSKGLSERVSVDTYPQGRRRGQRGLLRWRDEILGKFRRKLEAPNFEGRQMHRNSEFITVQLIMIEIMTVIVIVMN